MKRLSKTIIELLVCLLPLGLFFSYYPVISLGAGESMNFELSIPLIWLVLFDVVGIVALICWRGLRGLIKRWSFKWLLWFLAPIFVSLSLLWSGNFVRGMLTCGVMWLVVVACLVVVAFQEWFRDAIFRKRFWRWFFGSALFVCGWCVVQCVLDIVGVSQDYSLMCLGCMSQSFGFPHPNGFAIEPQFMGNLLLAPALVAAWMAVVGKRKSKDFSSSFYFSSKFLLFCFFVTIFTLFLTMSRGAIYAFVVGLVFMSALVVAKWKKERKLMLKRVGIVWGVTILGFLFTLNAQGIMAQVGPTNDTYMDGVAKVLNQLSLGVIDIRSKGKVVDDGTEKVQETTASEDKNVVEKPVENSRNTDDGGNEAVFDGYVEESTNVRLEMNRNAIEVWKRDLKTMMFGVGIGGAGEAMYQAGYIDSPKEIVQNEYISLLLEVGLVGVVLLVVLIVMIVMTVSKNGFMSAGMVLTLLVAYGVSLLFFSGFANALQIYLLPVALLMVSEEKSKKNR